MRVIVLGAGVIGVTSAWYLAEAGHEVCVIDRQDSPAMETSFANGSQISVSHAEPWANPLAPLKVLRWLGREDSPLLWRMRADADQWRWGMKFLLECLPGRTLNNVRALVALGLHSRSELQALRRTLGLSYDELERGILHFYSNSGEFAHAATQAEFMRELGCDRRVVSAEECLTIEPALVAIKGRLLGGTYTSQDESGDAHIFTRLLAEHCVRRGVEFKFGTSIASIRQDGGEVAGVALSNGEVMQADMYVLAAGSYSKELAQGIGVNLPIYPAKGYSITVPLTASDRHLAPVVSLTDDEHKVVFSRLGDRLRVAGTAEFCGYDTSINPQRVEAIVRRTEEVFPRLMHGKAVEPWAGLRPATPGNLPIVSATKYRNFFLNTGHGTLGWTLACGSASLLTAMIAGKQPPVAVEAYRFG